MSRNLIDTESRIDERLAVASVLVRAGMRTEAEQIYRETLEMAEVEGGETSALAGLVLLDLVYFYEAENRQMEAKAAWDRIRVILMRYRNPQV